MTPAVSRRPKARRLRRGSQGPEGGSEVPPPSAGLATVFGIAQSTRQTLALSLPGSLSSVAGAYAENTFFLNSAYNSGTSAQGYAKWIAFYRTCFVLGARIVVRGVQSTAVPTQLVVGLVVTTNTNSLVSAGRAVATGMSQYHTINTNPDRFMLTQKVNVARYLHKKKIVDDTTLQSTASSDPSNTIIAHLFTQGLTGANSTVQYQFVLEFDCLFADPVPFT